VAEASEITQVRTNTNQTADALPWTDDVLGALIDALGVTGASASVWRSVAASLSGKVDVTEAGASHKFSDLFKNAQAMAKHWGDLESSETAAARSHPRVNSIVRT